MHVLIPEDRLNNPGDLVCFHPHLFASFRFRNTAHEGCQTHIPQLFLFLLTKAPFRDLRIE